MNLMLLGPEGREGACYTLANGETIIGRRPDCRIVLDAPSIAPRHARLFCVDGHTVIYTIDEDWPVYVNGTPVERQVLVEADEIELGHYRMRYGDAASAPERQEDESPGESRAAEAVSPAKPDQAATAAPPEPPAEAQPPVETELSDAGHEDGDAGAPDKTYHLDILTGINRGRRVALTRDRVVLGFNQEPLVELRNDDGALSLRRIAEDAVAELNGAPLAEEPAEARPGDVISVQRIELRIYARASP